MSGSEVGLGSWLRSSVKVSHLPQKFHLLTASLVQVDAGGSLDEERPML